jgi:recombinational DNA repair protein (RecF pathway)
MTTPLEDPTSATLLASPGGPLHEAPVTHCEHCRKPLPEHGFYRLGDDILCQGCAVYGASDTLLCHSEPLDETDHQALAILRQFVHEVSAYGRR